MTATSGVEIIAVAFANLEPDEQEAAFARVSAIRMMRLAGERSEGALLIRSLQLAAEHVGGPDLTPDAYRRARRELVKAGGKIAESMPSSATSGAGGSPKRRLAQWAFAVYDGIVRAVYAIDTWERPPEEERVGSFGRRWAFQGHQDEAMEDLYIWDVSGYLTPRAQNPIKYVNC